jgi:hypothetical protein
MQQRDPSEVHERNVRDCPRENSTGGAMKYCLRFCLPVLLLGVLFLSGCSYSRVLTSWRDDSFQRGQLKKTMVLAVVEKKIVRWRLEDEFAQHLRALGVDAVQSYKTFPDLKGVDAGIIKAAAVKAGLDSVLVSRLVDTRKETIDVAPSYSTFGTSSANFNTYYGSSYTTVYSPGYTYDYKVFSVQNNLYSVHDEKLVWSAIAEAEEPPEQLDAIFKQFTEVIINDLKAKNIY